MMPPQLPPQLINICDFMQTHGASLHAPMDDDRVNAAINESKVIAELKNNFPFIIEPPRPRHWWDFAVQEADKFYPVNIKITQMKSVADNMNCKLGMYYALTGEIAEFANESSWQIYLRELSKNIKENNKDYYFLVINKSDSCDVILQRLKTLGSLNPSGSNLPFQCVWEHNRQPLARTFEDAKKFLLSNLGKSISLRADIYLQFRHFFPNYLEQ